MCGESADFRSCNHRKTRTGKAILFNVEGPTTAVMVITTTTTTVAVTVVTTTTRTGVAITVKRIITTVKITMTAGSTMSVR